MKHIRKLAKLDSGGARMSVTWCHVNTSNFLQIHDATFTFLCITSYYRKLRYDHH